jgi:hypothetical protein
MIKKLSIFFFFSMFHFQLSAQSVADSLGLSIQKMAYAMQENDTLAIRIQNDSIFTLKLWETLETPNSFGYSFDSLQSIKQIVSPDGRFKIFTWQLALNNEHFIQKGILQFKTSNNKIHLLALKDVADEIENPSDYIGYNQKWIGAVYYDIIQNDFEGKTYYTLLGFDAYDNNITHKLIEVLHFENEQPIFGGDFFRYPADETYPEAPVKRFIYSYKKGSNAFIRYEKDTKAIVLSELASITNDLKEKSSLVPTGDELYFIWKQGKCLMPKK